MVPFLALLLSFSAIATDKDTFETSYPRDNTFCQIGGKKLEIMVRSDHLQAEPEEKMWGEYVFARLEDKPAKRWPITKESGLYRLFPGNPSSCTKIVGTSIGDKFVLLFQKLNSPHKHQLIVQYLNPKTLEPLETLHTPYLADKAEVRDGFFLIRTHPLSRQEADMGKVTIGGNEYRYQDHRYPVWVSMGKNGFTTESEETFRTFSYKKLFKNIDDFKRAAGWDASGKSFSHLMIYVAINHKLKSKCILLVKNRTALTGNENWICQ